MQAGDVNQTWADVSQLQCDYNYQPQTPIKIGVNQFITWYKQYYRV